MNTNRVGTSHFVSQDAAIKYYSEQFVDEAGVKQKLEAGEIHIGAPHTEQGQIAKLDMDGRYYITPTAKPEAPSLPKILRCTWTLDLPEGFGTGYEYSIVRRDSSRSFDTRPEDNLLHHVLMALPGVDGLTYCPGAEAVDVSGTLLEMERARRQISEILHKYPSRKQYSLRLDGLKLSAWDDKADRCIEAERSVDVLEDPLIDQFIRLIDQLDQAQSHPTL
ncbi:hypothetical protein [Uliginosibacterium gangwonense]|uniref:hypothetical protein n=1 Tax=Uliginosibacterium gangwonense TaxID=392736 RepID=UPI0003637FEB|nr:hypothetical protein [Uliginosibacterium gangwonense]